MTTGTSETIGTDKKFEKLDEVVNEALERLKIPGAAVGILYDGQEYTKGYGVTNLQHPLPVNDETLFQIASISKTFTATTAMRLVEQGKLDLDAPIKNYLPGLKLGEKNVTENVTLRHVFTHMGGWQGDHFEDNGPGDDALQKYVERMENLPQLTPLGETWSYNNSGFTLAGRVIEVVTGKTFENAVKELVLDPLNLKHTFFTAEEAIVHRVAVGHHIHFDDFTPTEVAVPWSWVRTSNPLGGLVSNVKDLLRYARFQMGDGKIEDFGKLEGEDLRLLKPETMKLMQTPLVKAGSLTDEIGVAWMIRRVGGVKLVGHSGASNGQMSIFQMAPEKKFAITVLTNANLGTILYGEIFKWALEHFLNIASEDATHLSLPSSQLELYTGRYRAPLSEIEIELKEGVLYLQSISQGGFPRVDSPPRPTPPAVRIAFTGPEQIVALDFPSKDARGEFLRNPDGSLAWLRFGGRIHKRIV